MTEPNAIPDDLPGTVDDWLPDVPKVAPVKPRRVAKPKVELRPIDKLAQQLDDPPLAADPAPGGRPPAPPMPPAEDPGPEERPAPKPREERPKGEIWKGCPVKPLGRNGAYAYYLDVHGQMQIVGKHEKMTIMQLFGNMIPQLCWHFPKMVKDPETEALRRKPMVFDADQAAQTMIMACSEKGLFDPDGAVRGVGAWADDDGALVYHLGDKLLIEGREVPPCTHQGRIYPAYPPIPHPAPSADKVTDPVPDVLAALATWNWARPEIDPMIALGLFGVQAFGGALDWRSAYWVTGGPGSGKSALQRLMNMLHGGDKGLIQSPDATARGIASLLGQSSMPVALDELEPGDEGSAKERAIIETARVAASGGRWMRGSSDQKGSSGQLRSTFLFSSVLIPGILKSQDLQRIITLSLDPFAAGAVPPNMRAETWRKRGAALKRQLVDRWPTWAQRLELWREAFSEHQITGRNADNWATTLAMADMAQSADLPSGEVLSGWTAKVARHIKADLADMGSDADELLMHLLSQPFEPIKRSEVHTLAQWLQVAGQIPGAPNVLGRAERHVNPDEMEMRAEAEAANAKLATIGLRVTGAREAATLFIASAPINGLKRLFEGTQWAGGAWKQSAARIKGALIAPNPRRLAGIQTRGTEVPYTSMLGLMAFPADRDRSVAPVMKAGSSPMDDFA